MMKMVLAAALAAAACAPVAALADDMAGHAMAPEMMATMVCRTAHTDEKPTAMMMGQRTPLVCKSVTGMMTAGKMGPDTSKAQTAQQADDAWQKWISQIVAIPVTPP